MVSQSKIFKLPKIVDRRGNLTFIESMNQIPFYIRRVYYLYDVPGGETRGGHAHKRTDEFLIAINGSFNVLINDGFRYGEFILNRAYFGLYIPAMTWRELENFSSGSICLVLASDLFDESDYIRDFNEFKKLN